MCYRSTTCPIFERRTINGIKGACNNCEYIKKFERTARWSRIGLIGAIVAFVITTYLIY